MCNSFCNKFTPILIQLCFSWHDGYISPDMKPPPISDGTPNESVADVFFRVIHLYFAQELSLVIDKYSALLCGRSPIAVVEPTLLRVVASSAPGEAQ